MVEHRAHQASQQFLGWLLAGRFPLQQVGQPGQPEQLTVRRAGVGHAVGVEQHGVVRLQVVRTHRRRAHPEPERRGRLAVQFSDNLPVAQQQRPGMPGTRPLEPSGAQRERGDDARGERVITVMIRECRVDRGVNARDRRAVPARVPVRAYREAGQHRRADAVPHPVDDREMERAVVGRVVERVTGDVIGRFQHPGDQHAWQAGAPWRQHVPLHGRGQRHVLAAPARMRRVAYPPKGGYYQAGEHA